MLKNIFFFVIICLYIFAFAPTSYACDPLGCLFGGHKQDTLILGEVTSVSGEKGDIKIIFVFPQNKILSLRAGDVITVKNFDRSIQVSPEESQRISPGKKYVMSLKKDGNLYVPAWGVYEVTGTTYVDSQLVKNSTADEAALQIFINSGGTETDFYFVGNTAFVASDDGDQVRIYPEEKNILWCGVGFGMFVFVVSASLVVMKKK